MARTAATTVIDPQSPEASAKPVANLNALFSAEVDGQVIETAAPAPVHVSAEDRALVENLIQVQADVMQSGNVDSRRVWVGLNLPTDMSQGSRDATFRHLLTVARIVSREQGLKVRRRAAKTVAPTRIELRFMPDEKASE